METTEVKIIARIHSDFKEKFGITVKFVCGYGTTALYQLTKLWSTQTILFAF